ncbi:MAG: hypothetical protein QE278_06360, partial [Limnobacter sp.]|nr:hypothetical protein [Limnobacter sp.]
MTDLSGVEREIAELVRSSMVSIQNLHEQETEKVKFVFDSVLTGTEGWQEKCPTKLHGSAQKLADHIHMLTTKNAALDLVDSKIMIADNDRVLSYFNKSANKMLSESQIELNKRLGNFRLEDLMGGSIDRYHKDPEKTAQMLREMTGVKEVPLKFGLKDFRLRVQALFGDHGEKLGLMAEWVDVTEEKYVTEEVSNLVESIRQGVLDKRIDLEGKSGLIQHLGSNINDALDAVIEPLNVAANYVDRISKGDIPEKITDHYNGDFNTIKNNLNRAIDAVNKMTLDADMLSKAAVDGLLSTRADASQHEGDFRKIVQGVNQTLDAVIGPLNVAANYVDRIFKGDIPEKITDKYNCDFNTIKNNLNTCISVVNNLVADADMLANAAVEGRLETRADATQHEGDFRKIVQGVNQTLDAVIGPLNVAANYVDRISKGDIPEKITDNYNGDFNTIKNNLNRAIDAVNKMILDADMLSKAAVDGLLSTRADASQHEGDFRKIVQGVNQTLDAVIGPLNVAANYVDRISKGDIPEKITDNYNGDFNTIKNNLNRAIDAVNK